MASQILRISIRGELPGGEVWSTNPCWEIDGQGGRAVTPGEAQTIATGLAAVTVPPILQAIMAVNTKLIGYRVEARRITGELEAAAESTRTTALNGNGASVHPHGTALVVSLRTPGVGAKARGRMYWPATGQGLQVADYRVNAGDVPLIATGFRTYLSAMETVIRVTLSEANLTVWSRSTNNFYDVNSLQVGNVLDSQRRRRDKLHEGYSAVTYP